VQIRSLTPPANGNWVKGFAFKTLVTINVQLGKVMVSFLITGLIIILSI
jgi:hypothetical protein